MCVRLCARSVLSLQYNLFLLLFTLSFCQSKRARTTSNSTKQTDTHSTCKGVRQKVFFLGGGGGGRLSNVKFKGLHAITCTVCVAIRYASLYGIRRYTVCYLFDRSGEAKG